MIYKRIDNDKPKFVSLNYIKVVQADIERQRLYEREQAAWDLALQANSCVNRGDPVFLHYSFNPRAKYWPHVLEIVEPKGDRTVREYWRYCNHMNDFIAERMDWERGQALDRNAGIFGFETLALATMIKMSWHHTLVNLPG